MIIAQNLSKTYRQTPVFEALDFQVDGGRFVCVVGESGSGKTTLLNLIAGLDQADKGRLQVAGVELRGRSKNQLVEFRRKHLAMIFQEFHLLSSLTVYENLVLPLGLAGRKADPKTLEAQLDQVGMLGHKNKLPQQLSGGEQQRVSIARALALEPKLLLADEPTGNLDKENSAKVLDLLCDLNKRLKLTVVMVTHSTKAAQVADQAFSMDELSWL